MQFRDDLISEATGDFMSGETSLTVRRRLSALVCHGRVSGLLLFVILTFDHVFRDVIDRLACSCK